MVVLNLLVRKVKQKSVILENDIICYKVKIRKKVQTVRHMKLEVI